MIDLPIIWAGLLALAVLIYVILDGFDLGIGILYPLFKKGEERSTAMNTVAPVWDGNETWLVLGGGGLLAAFPLAYSIVMSALYAPILAMLFGLIFRGVSFEFRWRDPAHEKIWDAGFFGGSLLATFSQGIVLGAFVQGIQVEGRAYGGGWFDWLTPFSLFTGVSLVIGYAFLGAMWLIMKTEGDLRAKLYKLSLPLLLSVMAVTGIVSLWTPFLSPDIYARWFEMPTVLYLSPVPILAAVLAWHIYVNLKRQRDSRPFPLTLGLFVLSYAGLGISIFPYVVPRAITVAEAASPDASLSFMLIGALIFLPLIIIYTGYSYWVFRGKVKPGEGYH
ncbi:MAG: cytochrome d ubiquinol oxidase subunit II [Parvularculaceae bacterium]